MKDNKLSRNKTLGTKDFPIEFNFQPHSYIDQRRKNNIIFSKNN